MALRIVWTPRAQNGLQKVLKYLDEDWTQKEIKLEQKINALLKIISKYPDIYPLIKQYPQIHKAVIDKNNYLILSGKAPKEYYSNYQLSWNKAESVIAD